MEKILVVDDEPKVLEITGQILETHDYAVTLTDSPEKALELLKDDPNRFDLILLDWKLRCALDGDMVLKLINHIYPDFKTRIIFITAHTKIASKHLIKLGAYDTLSKPVTAEQLIDAVDRALGKKPPDNPHQRAPAELSWKEQKKLEMAKKIIDALSSTRSRSAAASRLHCSRMTLYRWLEKTNLDRFLVNKEP